MTDDVDLTTLDDEGLYLVLEAADDEIRAASAKKQKVKEERDRRALLEAIGGLSDAQKQQLAQNIDLLGIDSTGGVGTPGGNGNTPPPA